MLLYTVTMPQLTEEELAKIYPAAKSYDEVQEEREQLQEKRRPKLVALKVGAYVAAAVAFTITAYILTTKLIKATIPEVGSAASTASVMIGVFGMCLIGAVTIGIVYYLYTLTSSLLYRTFAASSFPTALLGAVFVATVTLAWFFAAERSIDGPPMSMFSTASA